MGHAGPGRTGHPFHDGVLAAVARDGTPVRGALLPDRTADARHLRWRRQGRRLPCEGGTDRERMSASILVPGDGCASVRSGRRSTRGSRRALQCCRRVDEKTGGLHAALFVDQIDHAFFPTTGFNHSRRLRRHGVPRLRPRVSMGQAIPGSTSWGRTCSTSRSRVAAIRFGHAGVRVLLARRTAASVRLSDRPVRRKPVLPSAV